MALDCFLIELARIIGKDVAVIIVLAIEIKLGINREVLAICASPSFGAIAESH